MSATHGAAGVDALDLCACRLCPRECGVDREAGAMGFCRAGARAEVFRYGPHHGEEPPLSGRSGSGTVFFSRCTLHCRYCQNFPFSQEGRGRVFTAEALGEALIALRDRGCHNWNLVSPTPWLPHAREAVARAAAAGPRLPVVLNTSGYERPEMLRAIDPWVDIYLTDLRYARPATAGAASHATDYVSVAREALRGMWEAKGPLVVDADGLGRRGTVCRVLILPGHADEAIASLAWIARHIGRTLPISLMAQYTPAYRADEPPWDRRIARDEYDRVVAALHDLGFEEGWVQDFDGAPARELLGFDMTPDSGG